MEFMKLAKNEWVKVRPMTNIVLNDTKAEKVSNGGKAGEGGGLQALCRPPPFNIKNY